MSKKTLKQLHKGWELSEDQSVFDYIYSVMVNGQNDSFIECFNELRCEDQAQFLMELYDGDTFAWNKSVTRRCVKAIIKLKFKADL